MRMGTITALRSLSFLRVWAYIKKFLLLALILCTVEFIPGNAGKLTTEAIVFCRAFNYSNLLCSKFCETAGYTLGECTLQKHGEDRNVCLCYRFEPELKTDA
ncbi:uncharacterized protein LOC111615527 [Centruroides sculpturatus]|uniref:uncharacterized protein LOC111615527 n=1 Tax=Centruroides sculpturatus TaxID=218467 RepID=UPI000C6CD9E6|nr:uncharacterized protein LOC111615527 [Centruroides sculpturatus]